MSTGLWVMAGELPAGKRRLARVVITAAVAAIEIRVNGMPRSPSVDELTGRSTGALTGESDQTGESDDESLLLAIAPEEAREGGPEQSSEAPSPRLNPLILVGGGVSAAVMISSTLLRNRWLERLARGGHVHPYRSLALRIALLSFIGTLPARLMEVQEKASSKALSGSDEAA